MASTEQHYSLRWNDYTVKIVTAFQSLRDEEDFVDVTVACDGHHYSAHKMVLSACSPYFRSLLRANPCQHPIVILKDVGHIEMERLLEFMYNGEVNIAQDQLAAFLKTAENLKIRGLAGSSEDIDQIHSRDSSHHYISCGSGTGANGGASGRSSPTLSFIPSQGTADDIAGEGGANSHHHSDSPPNKRRKRISIPSAGHPESNSASHNTDSLVADGNTIEDATTATGRSSSGGLVDDDLRIDRRELKSEPSDSVGEVYSEPSEISGEPQHAGDGLDSRQPILYPLAAMPGHSGPSTSGQENLGSQEPGGLSDPGEDETPLDVSGSNSTTSSFSGFAWHPHPSQGGGMVPPPDNQCIFCFKSFSNRGSMTRHLRDQHLQPGATVSCEICGKVCKNRNCLITHRSVAHSVRRRPRAYPQLQQDEGPPSDGDNATKLMQVHLQTSSGTTTGQALL